MSGWCKIRCLACRVSWKVASAGSTAIANASTSLAWPRFLLRSIRRLGSGRLRSHELRLVASRKLNTAPAVQVQSGGRGRRSQVKGRIGLRGTGIRLDGVASLDHDIVLHEERIGPQMTVIQKMHACEPAPAFERMDPAQAGYLKSLKGRAVPHRGGDIFGGQGRIRRLFRRRRSGLAWPRQLRTSCGCGKHRGKERAPCSVAKELVSNAHAIQAP